MASVASLLARLAAAHPRERVTPRTLELYAADLAAVPRPLLDRAVGSLCRSGDWFPTVAQIRARCADLALGLPSEADALRQVEARASRGGRRTELHPLVAEALVAAGGVAGFRASPEPGAWRGQFARGYRELRARVLLDAQTDDRLGGQMR